MQKFLYLPRLRSRAVYEQTLRQAEPLAPSSAAPSPPFGTASAQHGDEFEGFAIGSPNVTLTDSLLLIEPSAAAAFAARRDAESAAALAEQADETRNEADAGGATLTKPTVGTAGKRSPTPRPGSTPPAKIKTFHGSVDVDAAGAKMTLRQIADDLIALLAGDPHATVTVTLEIAADFPKGASETMRRSVSENAATLKFKSKVWE